MDTMPRLYDVEQMPTLPRAEVEAFFDALKREQTRFLESFRHASSLLSPEPGQLACVAATQGRLAQRFFDAQRSIMMRRAEVDAEVAALGVAIVPTMAETGSLERVINEAFEPDSIVAQRQLTSLLDTWWRAEIQEGKAIIDDANARTAMRRHIAGIVAGEVVGARREVDHITEPIPVQAGPAQLLPQQLLAVLDGSESTGLRSLLDALADSLEPRLPVVVSAEPNRVDDLVIRDEPVVAVDIACIEPEDAFRHFWASSPIDISPSRNLALHGSTTAAPRRSLWRLSVRVVLPMAAAMSAIALFMAWMG